MLDTATSEGRNKSRSRHVALNALFSDKIYQLLDDTNLLVAIIDTNPLAWQQSANADIPLSLDDAVRQILLFFNAHIAFKHDNKIAAIASHIGHW
jgi:hypothetical protein